MDKFLTDIKKIRDNARKHMEQGAVTEGYKADRQAMLQVFESSAHCIHASVQAALFYGLRT